MPYSKYKEDLKHFFEQYYLALKAEDELYVQAVNIPEEMRIGELDEDGWGTWKLVPSTLTNQDIEDLEMELSIQLPDIFKAFLTTYHHYFNYGIGINPIDRPLYEVKNSANPILLQAGFAPFAWDPEYFYTYYIDCKGQENSIYKIDHEILFDFEPNVSEETIREHMIFVASDLNAYLKDILTKQQERAKNKLKQSK